MCRTHSKSISYAQEDKAYEKHIYKTGFINRRHRSDILEVYRAYSGIISFADYYDGDQVFAREEDEDYLAVVEQREKMLEEKHAKSEKEMEEYRRIYEQDHIFVIAQAYYGNRAGISIKKDEIDDLILGYKDRRYVGENQINRTLIPVPGTDNLVIVYNKYQEEKDLNSREEFFGRYGKERQPLAENPELGITLYSRCIVCRISADGELESIKAEDWDKFEKYLAESWLKD